MIRITSFAGRRVAVFGLGASGIATAKALLAAVPTSPPATTMPPASRLQTRPGSPPADLKDANWAVFSALILAPGVPLTHPEPHWTVRAARLAGVEVIGDLELFVRERRTQPFPVPLIAITGTNGKSTTTALTAHILTQAGRDTQVGGNIGTAMLSLEPFAPGRHYVIECSSYQVDLAPSLDASVGVLLNVTPDHLDRHGTIENYAASRRSSSTAPTRPSSASTTSTAAPSLRSCWRKRARQTSCASPLGRTPTATSASMAARSSCAVVAGPR